jgi:type I restriction enzyme S subunit
MTLPGWWSEGTISDVAEVIRGVTYSKADTLTSEGNDAVPLLRATNLEPGKIDYDDMVYIPKSGVKPRQFLQVGDVFLAASSGSISVVGKSAQVKFSNGETFGAFCAVIRPKTVNPKFLGLWVQTPFVRDLWSSAAKGTNINNLKSSDLLETKIPLPSLPEQERIVEILEDHLSRLDAALADVKQAKLKAAQFKLSLLNSAFTGTLTNSTEANWKKVRLIDCLEKLDSGKFAERGWSPQCLNYPVTNPNVWGVLKTTAVQMGEYQSEHNKELPNELIPKTHLKVMQGDFLMTTTGPRNRCGVICLVKATPSNLIFSGKILRFRANEKTLSSNWLMYLLMSGDYQKILNDLKVGTSDSSVSIGNKQILDLEIPLPTLSEQSRILAIIEEQMTKVDSSMKASDFIERNSEALRRSLLQAAFTGQLTKKEVNV